MCLVAALSAFHVAISRPHNLTPQFLPNHQNETHVPLRSGTAGVLGIFALLKLGRFAFRVRDRTRLIQNRQVYVLLCHLVVFIGLCRVLTADATDPLRAFESLTPCFLVNAPGTHTALFPILRLSPQAPLSRSCLASLHAEGFSFFGFKAPNQ